MKIFRKLLFGESLFIGISIVVWGFTPNHDMLAAAAFATVAFALSAVAITVAALEQPLLRVETVVTSVAIEVIAIFLLFNYGWLVVAITGILILFGMRYLPERLVLRSAVADN